MPINTLTRDSIALFFVLMISSFLVIPCFAGPYRDSAHGDLSHGVDRSAIDSRYAEFSRGNCAHCHEMHASLQGAEPAPVTGAMPHALFAPAFNETRQQNPYVSSDNFCFYCHSEESAVTVRNQDYSTVFGGATSGSGPQSIMSAFNQLSYHNLYDVWNFLNTHTTYSLWFTQSGNPCSGCHNSHLAKRNWDSSQPGFPLLSAISQPGNHQALWGESQVMAAYTSYEAPYSAAPNREPAGVGDPDGTNTPDYPGFCISCHDAGNIIWSTPLNRNLKEINWQNTGLYMNKHGALSRDGSDHFREPYTSAAAIKSNFVLSCMDCHEAHGSENIMLLRRRVNGENLESTILSTDAMSVACKRCHQDDLAAAAGTGQANRWEFVHHGAIDAPYAKGTCSNCHLGGDGAPIACGNCHGHGMDDSWAGTNQTGRITF